MTLKEKLENNIIWVCSSLVITSFTAGIFTPKAVQEIFGFSIPSITASNAEWEKEAQKSGWIPKKNCLAYPLSVSILSPGENSTVQYTPAVNNNTQIATDIVVQTSRLIAPEMDVGLIIKEDGHSNYYVDFPYDFIHPLEEKNFRADLKYFLPFDVKKDTNITLWAFVVEERSKFGSIYGTFDQIKDIAPEMAISNKISFRITKTED